MLDRLSARFSRRRIRQNSAAPLRVGPCESYEAYTRAIPATWLSERHGEVKSACPAAQPRIEYSMVAYQALEPHVDAQVLEIDNTGPVKHIFAAVITASRTAQGVQFLRRNLHSELMRQIWALGEVHQAIRAAIFSLDRIWRDMHPFNRNVLEGISLSAVYVDLNSNWLYLASTGACRAVVGSRNSQGEMEVTADVHREQHPHSANTPNSFSSGVATVHLTESVDTVILGSQGFWHDVSAHSALLRMQHFYASTPSASDGNAAAHLTNYALHNVVERTKRMRDPRMRAIRQVIQLQSLWAGDIGNYKWGGRQPVRRRRGDVHGDMASVVLHINWPGKHQGLSKTGMGQKKQRMGLSKTSMPKAASTSTLTALGSKGQACWELLRMHFLDFPREHKKHVRQQWYAAVDGVMQQLEEAKRMQAQIQSRAPHRRHVSGLPLPSPLVGVNA